MFYILFASLYLEKNLKKLQKPTHIDDPYINLPSRVVTVFPNVYGTKSGSLYNIILI